MFRSPRCGPLLGTGSNVPAGRNPRSDSARLRSCGDPAGRWPTASCARTSVIARSTPKRSGVSESSPPPPQPATAAATSSAAIPRDAALSGLLAPTLDAGRRRDRWDGRLVMTAGTIPDHIGLRNSLLARLRLHLAPGELGFGEVIPAGQIERLESALQRRPPVLFGAEHRPDYLKLLIAEPDDPHVASSYPTGIGLHLGLPRWTPTSPAT